MKQVSPECSAETEQAAILDVVFIHGLGGDIEKTWQRDPKTFWPKWIASDFPECRVYVAGYDSTKFAGFFSGGGASLQDIATMMVDELISRENPAPNLLLVCHSLGGLIAKQLFRKCEDSLDTDFNELSSSIRGFVFLGTPHQGSQLSSSIDAILKSFTSTQAKQLQYSDDALIDLNNHFKGAMSRSDVVVKSYYETKKTWGVMVVDKVTGNPGVLASEPVAVEADHAKICKPKDREAKVYKSVCATIRKILRKVGPPTNEGGRPNSCAPASSGQNGETEMAEQQSVIMSDYEYFTTVATDDRRDLETKLKDANRAYLSRDARGKKERFAMELRSRIAQPAAITRYTKLMSDVDSRYKRHVSRVIAESGNAEAIDEEIQKKVINPCVELHSSNDHEITAKHVDEVLYYLAGNCHLAWDND